MSAAPTEFWGSPTPFDPQTPFSPPFKWGGRPGDGSKSRPAENAGQCRTPLALSIKIDGARYHRDYGQSDRSLDQGYNLSLYYKALQVLSKCLLEYLLILAHICCIVVVSFADNQKRTFVYSHDLHANLLYGDNSYSSNNTLSDQNNRLVLTFYHRYDII